MLEFGGSAEQEAVIRTPQRVARVIRRFNPRLELKFSRRHGKFVVLVRGRETGKVSILFGINGRPSIGTVMPALRKCYVGDLRSKFARDRFCAEMDEHNTAVERKKTEEFRDWNRREGADRLAHEFRKLPGLLGRG